MKQNMRDAICLIIHHSPATLHIDASSNWMSVIEVVFSIAVWRGATLVQSHIPTNIVTAPHPCVVESSQARRSQKDDERHGGRITCYICTLFSHRKFSCEGVSTRELWTRSLCYLHRRSHHTLPSPPSSSFHRHLECVTFTHYSCWFCYRYPAWVIIVQNTILSVLRSSLRQWDGGNGWLMLERSPHVPHSTRFFVQNGAGCVLVSLRLFLLRAFQFQSIYLNICQPRSLDINV